MTIVVTGDNQLAKENLASAIETAFSHSPVCVDCFSTLTNIPDISVILVDYSTIARDSLKAMRAIVPPLAKVAVYGAPGNAEEAMGWLCQGYDGYLPRSMTAPAIVCAVQLMLRGERFVPAIAISGGDLPSTLALAGADHSLSPRQLEVLGMVATGASNKHIARALNVEEVTVKSHVKAIFRKLGVRSRTEAARHVLSPSTAGAAMMRM